MSNIHYDLFSLYPLVLISEYWWVLVYNLVVIGFKGSESTGMSMCSWTKKGSVWNFFFRGICLFYQEHCQRKGNLHMQLWLLCILAHIRLVFTVAQGVSNICCQYSFTHFAFTCLIYYLNPLFASGIHFLVFQKITLSTRSTNVGPASPEMNC